MTPATMASGHDMLGNLETGESTFTYGYDLENRMRSAVAGSTTISLAYDPLGLLNAVTSNGTTTGFLYDGLDLVAEYNSSGAVLRRYVHGAGVDEPLVWYEGAGTTDRRYLHADERGSIVAISSSSGAGLESFKYSPDGESANAASSRFGYTGQVWLAQVGLYYYKSRMYSPKLGRFLQPDAIGYGGGMNLYAYVGGDPINWVDPLGYNPEGAQNPCDQYADLCRRGDPAAGSIMERDIDALDMLDEARNAALQSPTLSPSTAIGMGSDGTAIAAGVAEFANVFDGQWLGKNGKWNNLSWGGNQWTGARSLALSNAEFWRAVTKGAFVVSAGVSVLDGIGAAGRGDGFGVATAASNVGWAAAGTWGGPAGWTGAATYTLTSWALQVPGVYGAVITAPLDFVCARSSGC